MNTGKTRRVMTKVALGFSLAATVSAYPLMRYIVNSQTKDFDNNYAVIDGDTVLKQKFYENIYYGEGQWRLQLKNGKVVNVSDVADFRTKDSCRQQALLNTDLKNTVDTVYVRYAKNGQKKYKAGVVYKMGTKDSLGYIPSYGMYSNGNLNLRYFKANNEELQKVVDFFNDKYNCTYRHEYQHYLNALSGLSQAGQSYETKFSECCLDEVSANIAQLLEQRRHYLEKGKDTSYITSRFKFYKDSIRSGKVKPQPGIYSQKEIELIAMGVFDVWMKEKFDLYIKNNGGRAIKILKETNYNGIQPDSIRHEELIKKIFVINGVDFYPHVAKRENEIRGRIPNEWLKVFRYLKKEKFKQMTYLDQLEQKKIEDGKSGYNMMIAKNKLLAQTRRLFNQRGDR